MNKSLWPIVTITSVVIISLVVILAITPAGDVATRSAVLALLAGSVPTIVGVWVKNSVDEVRTGLSQAKATLDAVQTQTNGHMSALIAAKTTPETVSPDVP
jgi:hypothetical protein